MNKLLKYYILILSPFPLIMIYFFKGGDAVVFLIFLLLYYVYRVVIDGQRLIEKKILTKNEVYKLLIPFYRSRYFRQLYFEN